MPSAATFKKAYPMSTNDDRSVISRNTTDPSYASHTARHTSPHDGGWGRSLMLNRHSDDAMRHEVRTEQPAAHQPLDPSLNPLSVPNFTHASYTVDSTGQHSFTQNTDYGSSEISVRASQARGEMVV